MLYPEIDRRPLTLKAPDKWLQSYSVPSITSAHLPVLYGSSIQVLRCNTHKRQAHNNDFKSMKSQATKGYNKGVAMDPETHLQMEKDKFAMIEHRLKGKSPVSLSPLDIISLKNEVIPSLETVNEKHATKSNRHSPSRLSATSVKQVKELKQRKRRLEEKLMVDQLTKSQETQRNQHTDSDKDKPKTSAEDKTQPNKRTITKSGKLAPLQVMPGSRKTNTQQNFLIRNERRISTTGIRFNMTQEYVLTQMEAAQQDTIPDNRKYNATAAAASEDMSGIMMPSKRIKRLSRPKKNKIITPETTSKTSLVVQLPKIMFSRTNTPATRHPSEVNLTL